MRKLLISAAIAVAALPAAAQSAPLWSLDNCITYAIENNIDVMRSRLNTESAQMDVTEAKDRFLPTVQAGASQNWNFGRGLTAENTYANRSTATTSWNIGASLPLFQGLSAKRQLDTSRANLQLMLANVERAKDDVTLNVISYYLQVLYNRELVEVATLQRDLSKAEVERRRELLEAGRIPELDLIEATSQLAQDETSLITAINDAALALTDLRLALNLPRDAEFDIQPLGDDSADVLIPDAATVYANAMANLPAVAASRLAITLADKQVAQARTGYIPTLSFNAAIGSSYYDISGIPNESFSAQMRHNFTPYLGFSLSIPVFDAFRTRNSIRRADLQVLSARLDYDDTARSLDRAITQAWQQATAARSQYQSGIIASEAARAAFEAMQTKYDYGRATATEYDNAKTAYIQSTATRIRNLYELLLRHRILLFYNRH